MSQKRVTRRELEAMIRNGDDITNLDVSGITDMSCLFFGYEDFNQDISEWDVSNVEDMKYMLYGCKNFNQDIHNWNVSNVKDMSYMFSNCDEFNQDISKWNVSKVRDMKYMFFGCKNFNQDLSKWNVSNVKTMSYMFFGCYEFNQDLSRWAVSKVKNWDVIFYHTSMDGNNKPQFGQSPDMKTGIHISDKERANIAYGQYLQGQHRVDVSSKALSDFISDLHEKMGGIGIDRESIIPLIDTLVNTILPDNTSRYALLKMIEML